MISICAIIVKCRKGTDVDLMGNKSNKVPCTSTKLTNIVGELNSVTGTLNSKSEITYNKDICKEHDPGSSKGTFFFSAPYNRSISSSYGSGDVEYGNRGSYFNEESQKKDLKSYYQKEKNLLSPRDVESQVHLEQENRFVTELSAHLRSDCNFTHHLSETSDKIGLTEDTAKPASDTEFTRRDEKHRQVFEETDTDLTRNVNIDHADAEIPPTNFLNEHWKIREEISLENLEVPILKSAIKLSFCMGNFKDSPGSSFTLSGSVHTDLGRLCKCLDIEDNRMLVSPVPEFHVGKNVILNDYAITEIPLCVPAMSSSLKVHWMETNKNQPKTMENIPFVECYRQTDLDIFYIIPEGRNTCVHVYTRHFSLFYCTACKEEIKLKLETEVFVREGSLDGLTTIHVKMPLLGPYEMLLDCREERKRGMEEINFRRIDRSEIKILKTDENTGLRFRLTPPPQWVHVINKGRDDVLYKEEQVMDETPSIDCVNKYHLLQDDGGIQWKMKCEEHFIGNVAFTIDVINFLHSDRSKRKESRLHPEFCVKGSPVFAEHRRSSDDPLRRLGKGLKEPETRKKLLEMLGHRRNYSTAGNVDLFANTLSDIHQNNRMSFVSKISLALTDMEVTCNEDINYFFSNFDKRVASSPIMESGQKKESGSLNPDLEQTTPKQILNGDEEIRHPVENTEYGSEEGHRLTSGAFDQKRSLTSKTHWSNGQYPTTNNSMIDQDETKPKSVEQETRTVPSNQTMNRGIRANNEGLQWAQSSRDANEIIANGFISGRESGIDLSGSQIGSP
ncbi:uncharacterized protein LOC117343215 [Pecten maximus]|uniref:uncharacterized protein LOC117343215 n=1 Tax=Pecten maximus TaxID=6579 RepID=UPI0014585288|nr:uncharacterized protein LOC117343215 [Pecten maximus]